MNNDLLKVMIVDDEELVRGLLKISVDWNEMGMVITGEASSGAEALKMIEDNMPDIIFTDVCMPFMDGLELSRQVIEKYPQIKIVVLTAYEEFDYAKKGIKVGLADFLLKPINGNEIKKVALNLRSRIEKERQHTEDYNSLKKRLAESYPVLLERFFNELLHNAIASAEIEEKLNYFSLDPASGYHRIAVLEAANSIVGGGAGEEGRIILDMQCAEMIRRYFKDDPEMHIFLDLSLRIVIFCSNPDADLVKCCEQIKVMLLDSLKCYISIGIGNACMQWKDAGVSYKEACDALGCRVFTGWNQVIDFNEISCDDKKTVIKNMDTDRIGMYVKSGAGEKAAELVDEIFNEIHPAKSINVEQIRMISANMIFSIINSMNEIGIHYSEVFGQEALPFNKAFLIDNLPDARKYTRGIAIKAANAIRHMRSKKENNTIRDIMKYMGQHLAEADLSLAAVAGRYYKNPSYLSRIFKQETGQNFIEYLTKLRMEKAMELLAGTDLKAYEIAEKVGIQDPNYFSMCFKKYTGMSINVYRKQIKTYKKLPAENGEQ